MIDGSDLKGERHMKLCVFSDSHGASEAMLRVLAKEKPALCFFLGDGAQDLPKVQKGYPELVIYAVRGNCDVFCRLPRELSCAVGGTRILALHGHRHEVKEDPSLSALLDAGRRSAADIILFGHTHTPLLEQRDGIWLMNPGSIGSAPEASYGVIHLENGASRLFLKAL